MTTQIFADYAAFLRRDDPSLNGVTQTFADANPTWDAERGSVGCWNCSDCSVCSDCSDCSGCSGCSDCSGCSGEVSAVRKHARVGPSSVVPIIEGIHQRVLAAVTATPDAFDMSDWHCPNACETTHCRGGWVVELAGDAGKALEAFHNTELAAYLIYKASSPIKVSFLRFYEENERAMVDIRRCATEEATLAVAP